MDGVTLTDTGSSYSYCAGITGGIFYLTGNSALTLKSPTINNIIGRDGGVYYLSGDNTLT